MGATDRAVPQAPRLGLPQQKSHASIRAALAAAACALVGSGARGAALPPVDVDSAVLFYSEAKRVTAVETVARISKQVGEEKHLRLKLVWDALTGASANGATPADRVQTFTRPSGRGTYRIDPGKTPLDDTFRDTRIAGTLSFETPWRDRNRVALGGNFSTEHDYRSLGLSTVFSRDFNMRNTTATVGVSGSLDTVTPEGGIPVPLAEMRLPGQSQARNGSSDDKRVADLLLGVTQVLNRHSLMQANYAASRSSGYLTDPYKIVSVVDASGGAESGEPVRYIYENRPETRFKQSLFLETKYIPGEDVIDLSYRYLWDDWGIRSHTVEARYRWQMGERTFLEPVGRFYRQRAADFHRFSLADGEATPTHVTGDYRLGAMDTMTGGIKLGRSLGDRGELTARVEYYAQMGDGSPAEAIGSQRSHDLFPTVEAVIAQLGCSIKF